MSHSPAQKLMSRSEIGWRWDKSEGPADEGERPRRIRRGRMHQSAHACASACSPRPPLETIASRHHLITARIGPLRLVGIVFKVETRTWNVAYTSTWSSKGHGGEDDRPAGCRDGPATGSDASGSDKSSDGSSCCSPGKR